MNLLEIYVIFVELTKKQTTYLTRNIILFMPIISLFSIFLLIKNLNE